MSEKTMVKAVRPFEGVEGFKDERSEPFGVSPSRFAELKANGLVEAAGGSKKAAEPANKKAPEPANKQGTGGGADREDAGLSDLTNKQLHEIAASEGVSVESDDNKASLIGKIMAARAAAGSR